MSVYECELCIYSTTNKSNYTQHMKTKRHMNKVLNKDKNIHECPNCQKIYKSRNGLWVHKKTCTEVIPPPAESTPTISTEEIIEILKQHQKLILKEQEESRLLHEESLKMHGENAKMHGENAKMHAESKKLIENVMQTITDEKAVVIAHPIAVETSLTNNITNNNIQHNVQNNTTFNLQFFLNETCKYAMNMTEFIESIKCDLNDVIRVGKMGYVDGIADIIISNLKKLEISQRPLHCSDLKRQSMYIKDNDVWEFDENHIKTRNAVMKVTKVNSRLVPLYKVEHPDCCKADSKYSDEYDEILVEAMGGKYLDIKTNQGKIVKKIAKETTIDKHIM